MDIVKTNIVIAIGIIARHEEGARGVMVGVRGVRAHTHTHTLSLASKT